MSRLTTSRPLARSAAMAAGALAVIIAIAPTALASPAPTDPADPNTRIVGGAKVAKGEYPWMVRLSMGCGGSMYTEQIVLTAAHCVDGTGPDNSIRVVYGVTDLQDPSFISRRSSFVYTSPTSRSDAAGDWALIKLASPIPGAATLPIATTKRFDSGTFTVAGWGVTKEGNEVGSRHLLKAEVPFVDDKTCRASKPDIFYRTLVPAAELCAGHKEGGIDTCQGDSGGPMFRKDDRDKWIQVGITSRGAGCARDGAPGIYTEVSTFATAIADRAADLAADRVKIFNTSKNVQIPDAGAAVTSPLTVEGMPGKAPSALEVDISIGHGRSGDLSVWLVSPDGTSYPLKKADGSPPSGDPWLETTYVTDASAELASGTWKLKVRDERKDEAGYVEYWRLIF